MVTDNYNSFSAFNFATVKLSDDVLRKAVDGAYRDRFNLDTGDTDPVCNNYNRFVTLDNDPSNHAIIKTGAGPIHINKKGTIAVTVVTSSGDLHTVKFSEVLYAPDMFVPILSHSKLRMKNLYYHGWHDTLLLAPHNVEVAFAPGIDGIPTLLQAKDELQAAQAFTFAAVNTTKPSSLFAPISKVSLRELHKMFGHADFTVLRQMVMNTTGLKITHSDS